MNSHQCSWLTNESHDPESWISMTFKTWPSDETLVTQSPKDVYCRIHYFPSLKILETSLQPEKGNQTRPDYISFIETIHHLIIWQNQSGYIKLLQVIRWPVWRQLSQRTSSRQRSQNKPAWDNFSTIYLVAIFQYMPYFQHFSVLIWYHWVSHFGRLEWS